MREKAESRAAHQLGSLGGTSDRNAPLEFGDVNRSGSSDPVAFCHEKARVEHEVGRRMNYG